MEKNRPVKTDLFGRKIKEKFPHYASGIIIPGCKGPRRHQVSRWPKSSVPFCAPQGQPYTAQYHAGGRSGTSSSRGCSSEKTAQSSKNPAADGVRVCKNMAKLIQEELPSCRFDPELLEEIQLKCEIYWKALLKNKIFLDEDAVMVELRAKLRSWAGRTHQVELDDNNTDDDDDNEEEDEEENAYHQLIEFPQDNQFQNT